MIRYRYLSFVTNVVIVLVIVSISVFALISSDMISTVSADDENVYYNGNKDSNYVSLMFNVYWGNEYLDSILNTLDEHNKKATFFIGGSWADDNLEYLKKIYEKGHEIASHGYFHKDYNKLSYEENLQEIKSNNILLKSLIGVDVSLFAPPSGSYNKHTIQAAKDLNMKVILWTKDTIDWRDKNSDIIYNRAISVKGGDFVLMHPTVGVAKSLGKIMSYYENNGFEEVTVSQNLQNMI